MVPDVDVDAALSCGGDIAEGLSGVSGQLVPFPYIAAARENNLAPGGEAGSGGGVSGLQFVTATRSNVFQGSDRHIVFCSGNAGQGVPIQAQ